MEIHVFYEYLCTHPCFPFKVFPTTLTIVLLLQSPDGYTVASAAADETLKFWQVFGAPDASKKKTKIFLTTLTIVLLLQSPDGYSVASAAADETLKVLASF